MDEEKKLVHSFEEAPRKETMFTKGTLLLFLVVILLGAASGYMFSNKKIASVTSTSGGVSDPNKIEKGATYGSTDAKTFKDSAEGTLKTGGIEGEGAFHLERPGGVSQNVYLTSSSLDLSKFVGKKVKVWGETNTAKKAGWLMDVGRLQVL